MGIIHKQYLEGTRIYSCSDCGTHLSTKDDIVSRVGLMANILWKRERAGLTRELYRDYLPWVCRPSKVSTAVLTCSTRCT